jgi:hypothetical protein
VTRHWFPCLQPDYVDHESDTRYPILDIHHPIVAGDRIYAPYDYGNGIVKAIKAFHSDFVIVEIAFDNRSMEDDQSSIPSHFLVHHHFVKMTPAQVMGHLFEKQQCYLYRQSIKHHIVPETANIHDIVSIWLHQEYSYRWWYRLSQRHGITRVPLYDLDRRAKLYADDDFIAHPSDVKGLNVE